MGRTKGKAKKSTAPPAAGSAEAPIRKRGRPRKIKEEPNPEPPELDSSENEASKKNIIRSRIEDSTEQIGQINGDAKENESKQPRKEGSRRKSEPRRAAMDWK